MADEGFYQRHRPKTFQQVVGQKAAIDSLRAMFQSKDGLPRALLLSGNSGCGKTTVARILRQKIGCSDVDFKDMNCAEARGIDDVREINSRMRLSPFSGKCRVWLLDEAHKFSSDAQSSLLKILEDPPRHCYFMLASSLPAKISTPVRSRCTEIKFKPLSVADLTGMVTAAATADGKPIDKSVAAQIAEEAEGNGRTAMVLLGKCIDLPAANAQIEAIQKESAKVAGFDIAQAMMRDKVSWKEIAGKLRACLWDAEEEPEMVRRIIIGYAAGVLSKGAQSGRAFSILQELSDDVFASGRAGIVRGCYAVVCGR